MRRLSAIAAGLLVIASRVFGGADMSSGQTDAGWVTLNDGATGLDNWNRVCDANWRAEDGAIVADKGKGGFFVSRNAYKDFQLRAEFWADPATNSGMFIRCTDPDKITATNAYEVNIYDQRPDPVRPPVRQWPQRCARRGHQVAQGADQAFVAPARRRTSSGPI